ncbi:MAG TPA: PTS sugar transporter subunit IIA [Peptococcaceae bacterium]|jgi:PTS system galactitol-specific IIA component|nr:PTS sugar transporter subunit IIA [Clostridia bacterium]HOB81387.1 PTS sugar transporter subunit IIA [Peptococcaceae bacterium]HPZ71528.1 PTS sugar transporter subunit IIA [Peptococcaceae bacterium]HQD53438.1 PTS sugar transporter subunit IIA [Peptococcaceae bacterium]
MLDLKLLDRDLVMLNIEADTQKEALEKLAQRLCEKGYVKDTYAQAILEREKVFPTGLPTEGHGVAIPHTDVEHVNKPAIALGILQKPIKFNLMGDVDPNNQVDVRILFMLAIKEPHMQLKLLQDIMEIIQDGVLLEKMVQAKSVDELVEATEQYAREKEGVA